MRGLDAGGRSTEEEALQALVPEIQDRHGRSVTRNVSGCNRLTAGCSGPARLSRSMRSKARSPIRRPLSASASGQGHNDGGDSDVLNLMDKSARVANSDTPTLRNPFDLFVLLLYAFWVR